MYINPIPATDIIIEYNDGTKDGIVLVERRNPPFGLALPGGFAEHGISLENNARKEAKEETGLDIIIENPEHPLCVHSDPKRDPRAHMVSVTYIAQGQGVLKGGDDAKNAALYSVDELVNLVRKGKIVFDHDRAIMKYFHEKELYTPRDFVKVGVIGRFKPLHNGGKVMLETLCEKAEHVIIGIGSTNKYNVRNPFTAEESKEMIEKTLMPEYNNFSFVYIPDFAHVADYSDGSRWSKEITKQYGSMDGFFSGDAYVTELLKEHYHIIQPQDIIPEEKMIKLRASQVRLEVALNDEHWKEHVPEEVTKYLEKNHLVERFRQQFGQATISQLQHKPSLSESESLEQEKIHTLKA
jgi:cytidyltransferase-like protein